VTKTHARKLTARCRLKGAAGREFVVVSTLKDGVRFTTAPLMAAARRLSRLAADYAAVQAEVARKAFAVAATYAPVVQAAGEAAAELDVLCAFAHAAAHAPAPYARPRMRPAGWDRLRIERGRHPFAERQDAVDFVANSVRLERTTRRLLVVTGPNMAGKSTLLRQVALTCVMAQVGSLVPAEAAELPLLDAVLARVGATDCQTRGISSFMQEMLQTASLLRRATPRSLVIVDELGRGTSTHDGFGLAWAAAEALAAKRSWCLFATHFHELRELEGVEGAGAANAHVTARVEGGRITMLYEVRDGACDRSFGINVARLAGFPDCVVAAARRKAARLEGAGPASRVEAGPTSAKRGTTCTNRGDDEKGNAGRRVGDAPARKRRRREEREAADDGVGSDGRVVDASRRAGEAAIAAFLDGFAALPLAEMEPAEAEAAVARLLDDVDPRTNAFVAANLTV
jgi:DNA mismatch repair protein MSH2